MRRGAYDFVTKPVNIDRLEMLLQRALKSQRVEKEVVELKRQVDKQYGLERLVGGSAPMQEVYDTIRQVAPTRATVLIQGESGTGKELVAQALHSLSDRSRAKFVTVHCAALSPQLLESELFGHEKGAFTGATERRIGRFEQANGGTLFLDEIGEIDQTTQVKLLRVLGEERSFERVGGSTTLKVDVRLVAATNRDLTRMVSEGKFREDLYFRLSVVPLTLPPLRARKEDLPVLVQAFLKSFAADNGKPHREMASEAMQAVLTYDWPGNVRELRTAVEHGVVMATGAKIEMRDLPVKVRSGGIGLVGALGAAHGRVASEESLDLHTIEDRLITEAMKETGGNVTKAAQRLGISRRTLHRRLKESRTAQSGE
jgi:DNA-binding NtrC family response regulator